MSALALFALLLPEAAGTQRAPDTAAGSAVADTVARGAEPDSSAAQGAAPDSSDSLPLEAVRDTSRRVVGTSLRFGYTPEMAQRHGRFSMSRAPAMWGEGAGRWFGVDGNLKLSFRHGRLHRVTFESGTVSPRARDYVQDQLRSSGYRRQCERPTGTVQVCTWTGRARVQLEISSTSIKATIDPPQPPREPLRPAGMPFAIVSETFVLGRPGVTSRLTPPKVAVSPAPEYPPSAEEQRVQGNVWVRATVDTAGNVVRAEVTRSIPELDDAALTNAMRWRFEPYRLNGIPASYEVEFPVRFVFH